MTHTEQMTLNAAFTLSKGYVFYCDWQGHHIEIKGSAFSGKETVYMDGIVVSQQRNWNRTESLHRFDFEQHRVDITLCSMTVLSGRVSCDISIDGNRLAYREVAQLAVSPRTEEVIFVMLLLAIWMIPTINGSLIVWKAIWGL